jgi:hypothetical protein
LEQGISLFIILKTGIVYPFNTMALSRVFLFCTISTAAAAAAAKYSSGDKYWN